MDEEREKEREGECEEYEWVIVGGGPCGTFAVASLLQCAAFSGNTFGQRGRRVCWVEMDEGHMGRLGRYACVPGNTTAARLVAVRCERGSVCVCVCVCCKRAREREFK
jgi:hypothetical protein